MRLILAINSANASVESAKLKLASSCLGLEQAASVAVSFPHYLADNMNEVTASGAEAIVHGLSTVLDMSVLAVEKILVFVVDMYRSMYLCLVELVVRGSMALAIGATKEFTEFFNDTVGALRNQLQDAINGADNALEAAVEVINRIPGVDIDAPDLNPNLDFLNNVAIPDSFLQTLVSFNDSLPTLNELKDKMNGVIEIPFERLRAEINTNLGSVTIDRGAFPVPEKETLAFCKNLDYTFVDEVGHTLVKVAQYGIIVIVVFILLHISAMVFLERRWFADLSEYVDRSRETWASDLSSSSIHGTARVSNSFNRQDMDRVINAPALLGFIGSSRNPLLRSWLPRFVNRVPAIRRSPRARSNLTWFVSYITYTPALLLLAVALLGLVSIEIQLVALKPTEKTAQDQVNTGLSSFRESIVAQVNNATVEKSMQYANGSNTALLNVQNGINEDMFGWVNSTTVNINTTVNEFYAGLTGAIDSTFQGTVFNTAAMGVVNCLIGTKVEAISKAMTWLHDNAHVTLPMVSNEIFMLSPNKSEELVSSLDGSNPEDPSASSSLVQSLVGQYKKALEKERTIFLIMLGLYVLVILFGLFALLWHEMLGPRWRNKRSEEVTFPKFNPEKSRGQALEEVPMSRFKTNAATRANQVGEKIGSLVASPLARLRHKKALNINTRTGISFNNVISEVSRQPSEMQQRAFSPPPAYPSPDRRQWLQQPSTISLLGALNLPDQTESRAGTPPRQTTHPAPLPLPQLYGKPLEDRPPPRPPRPASHFNPFLTPFDGPDGL
ncbi:hypothetical protein P389DRAFT_210332 [Cystobasidium minutum MCA 4210]|uniref:uncharacterized protein n=1 Tax=Cystobasidium minutum MCA 4210 TaxID=1397322 RepID=UPI0034CF2198|eukprot:jgi/Rhomi1/210332/estExt_Genemark1.C_3_t30083